jgi:Pyridoxamine 5'-phosphate oxidase
LRVKLATGENSVSRTKDLGKISTEIDDTVRKFIEDQSVFFVATAPLDPNGHVNLSPKGLDSLRILGPKRVAYVDLVGSGVETIAHLKDNGRIVMMFCAFQGPPNIVRIHGHGQSIEPHEPGFEELAPQFPAYDARRAIISVEVTRVSSSCGYAVPRLKFEGERSQLFSWAQRKGPEGLKAYREEKNRRSIDGLPGLAE